MIIKRSTDVPPSEITPKGIYEDRRRFMTLAAGAALLAGRVAAKLRESGRVAQAAAR